MPEERLADLHNLGPKSAEMLAEAGIHSVEELRRLGAVEAFARTRRALGRGRASLNLLWALEAALTGSDWQSVARTHRTSLLLALEDAEARRDVGEAAPTGTADAVRPEKRPRARAAHRSSKPRHP